MSEETNIVAGEEVVVESQEEVIPADAEVTEEVALESAE